MKKRQLKTIVKVLSDQCEVLHDLLEEKQRLLDRSEEILRLTINRKEALMDENDKLKEKLYENPVP